MVSFEIRFKVSVVFEGDSTPRRLRNTIVVAEQHFPLGGEDDRQIVQNPLAELRIVPPVFV